MKRSFLVGSLLVSLALLFSIGCSGSSGKPHGKMKFVNAVYSSKSVDFIKEIDVIAGDMAYLESTDYIKMVAKSFEFRVNETGSFSSIIKTNFGLARKQYYTFIAGGTIDKATAIILLDDNKKPASGRSKIRFIDASKDSIQVNGYVVPKSSSPQLPAVKKFSFGNHEYVDGDMGSHYFTFSNSKTGGELVRSAAYDLEDQEVKTVILTGTSGHYQILVLTDRPA